MTQKRSDSLLRWAIDFAQMNLVNLREGDWLNLKDDLGNFTIAAGSPNSTAWDESYETPTGGIAPVPSPHEAVQDMTPQDFRTLQEEAKKLLRATAVSRLSDDDRERFRNPLSRSESAAYTLVDFQGSMRFYMSPIVDELFVYGEPAKVFLIALILIIKESAALPVGLCPEDQRLFFRVGRQRYCSHPCVLRANKRDWRKREAQKQSRRKK